MSKKYLLHSLLVCDDIRMEANGKAIIIGVYDEAIIFQSFPAAMPKLMLRLSLTLLEAASTFTLDFVSADLPNLSFPDEALPFKGKGTRGNLLFEFTPIVFRRDQECKVMFGLDGEKELVARLDVRLPRNDDERQVMDRATSGHF